MNLHALIVAVLLGAADKPADKTVEAERKNLQGSWLVLASGEHRLDPSGGLFGFSFSADKLVLARVTQRDKKQVVEELFQASCTVDPGSIPRTIDIAIMTGPEKGKTVRGIYHRKGDRMRLCLADPGRPRPTTFELRDGWTDFYCERPNPEAERKALVSGAKIPASLGLPLSASARPLESKADVLTLHIAASGAVFRPGAEKELSDLRGYLREQYRERRAGKGNVATILALRADRRAIYAALYAAACAARESGFRQLEVRALIFKEEKEERRKGKEDDLDRLLDRGIPEGRLAWSWDGQKAALTVLAHAYAKQPLAGFLQSLELEDARGTVTRRIEGPQKMRDLQRSLTEQRKKVLHKEDVTLAADAGLDCAHFVQLMDACVKSGFHCVHFAAPFNAHLTDAAAIAGLKEKNEVREVVLEGPKITDAELHSLGELPRLRKLTLRRVAVTDSGLDHLARLRGLRQLVFVDTPINDASLAHLKGLTELRALGLEKTRVRGKGLGELKDLMRLEELLLRGSEISTGFTRHLKAFPRLRLLDLSSTTVGDGELQHLHGLSGLDRLILIRTRVTDEGVKKLEKALPRLSIYR